VKAAELFIRCLEQEPTPFIFGVPGEENLDLMDALLDSSLRFILTRHEQGAAFMADAGLRDPDERGDVTWSIGLKATR
jgi:acetolactate synthase-1/2/3 large subunit